MPSKQANNPAGRLIRLLELGAADKRLLSQPAHDAFASLIGTPASEKALLLRRVGQILQLATDVQNAVGTLSGIEPTYLVAWIPKFSAPWTDLNFGKSFSHFMQPVDETMLSLLRIADDMLSRQRPEPTVEIDDVEKLLSQVRQLAPEIGGSSIPPELKDYLLRYVDILECALSDYRVRGFASLHEGFESAIGHFRLNLDLAPAADSNPLGKKLLGYLGIYTLIVTGAVATLQIPHEIQKYLPPPTSNQQGSVVATPR